jgi:flagellar capping protein FliD
MRTGIAILISFLFVSCTNPAMLSAPAATTPQPSIPTGTSLSPSTPVSASSTALTETVTVPEVTQAATADSNCANEEVNQLGESIASSYSFTTPQEVMSWFCDGAEFEDIIAALETQEITGEAAEDLLQMRSDGLSWDEIWQVIGLYDK